MYFALILLLMIRRVYCCHMTDIIYSWSLGAKAVNVVCLVTDKRYTGNLLFNTSVENQDYCQALCAVTDQCVGFSYRMDQEDEYEDCEIFSSRESMITKIGYISGPPRCNALSIITQNSTSTTTTLSSASSTSLSSTSTLSSSSTSSSLSSVCQETSTFYTGLPLIDVSTTKVAGTVDDYHECQEMCNAESACNQFEFKNTSKECVLSNGEFGTGTEITATGSVTGPKRCGDRNMSECFGNNASVGTELYRIKLGKKYSEESDISACRNLCKQKQGCVWVNFISPNKCYLLSAAFSKETRSNSTSGPPDCGNKTTPTVNLPDPDVSTCIEKDVSYEGFNIFKDPGSSKSDYQTFDTVDQCQAECNKLPECNWFDYSNKQCFLKYSKGIKTYKQNFQSGPPKCGDVEKTYPPNNTLCIESSKRYDGIPLWKKNGTNRYNVVYKKGDEAENCQQLCDQTSGCVWFNFDYKKRCYLLSYRVPGDPVEMPGYFSGAPSCDKKNYQSPSLSADNVCLQDGIEYIGPSFSTSDSTSAEFCKNLCIVQKACDCFTYNPTERKCYKKTTCYYRQYKAGITSGTRQNCQ